MYVFLCIHPPLKAYRHGLHYPINQFLTLGWYGDGWLVEPQDMRQLNCTLKERVMTLNYALTVKMLDYNTNTSLIAEGRLVRTVDIKFYYQDFILSNFGLLFQTLLDFQEQYMEKLSSPINDDLSLDKHLSSSSVFPYSQHCHEAVITLAHALNRTSKGMNCDLVPYTITTEMFAFPASCTQI